MDDLVMAPLKSTVIRDFGGGLNVVDDELNLSSSFQPVLDNIHRGVDNTLSVRWGTELFVDLRRGSVLTGSAVFSIAWTIGQRSLVCDYNAHGLQNGDHITFVNGWTNMLGLKSEEIIGKTFGVRIESADRFHLVMTTAATVTGFDNAAKTVTKDTHFLAGDIVELVYYDVAVDSLGEIVKVNAAMQTTKIWDHSKAFITPGSVTPGPGWSNIDYASSAIFKGELIIVNGIDKPVIINFQKTPNCTYLADAGAEYSTVNVPVCRYVCAIDKWLIMAGDPLMPYKVHISATNSSGTWQNPADETDNDGVAIELNNTNSSSVFIRGVNKFRNFLAVAFDDTVAMVELGIFDGTQHRPEVTDSVARHGAIAHKSMVFLGFDLVMADPIGVPSFAKSQFDNSIIPSRMSEFIAPMLQMNISRLTAKTLERDIFSVYSTHDNRYVLFVPNHDDVKVRLPNDPIYYLFVDVGTNRAVLNTPNHGMVEGEKFSLSGLTDTKRSIPSGDIPAECTVEAVLNENLISFRLLNIIVEPLNFGGIAVDITRKRTETIAYALTYNKGLKIKAWSRYRGWDFRAGTTSLYGRVFLADKSHIWRMGNRYDPIHADYMGLYDHIYANNTTYTAGTKVRDVLTNEVYTAQKTNTTSVDDSFEVERESFPDNWIIYKGMPINFDIEFPWADFDKRDMTKLLKTINVDAKGRDRFTVEMYLDYYYKHKVTGARTPLLSMDMVGGDEGGFGVHQQSHGTGRLAIRQRPIPFEARGKLFKFRIFGSTIEPLRFIAFIFGYKIVGRDR
jgi:hypothetical protein